MSTHAPPSVSAFAMSEPGGGGLIVKRLFGDDGSVQNESIERIDMGDAVPDRLFWVNDDVPAPDDDEDR